MELFDLLETRVVELLGQIDTLREENKTLQEKVKRSRRGEQDSEGVFGAGAAH